jgi:predicted RNA-binding Zn-ribbon protein involved in translation (DUF1610 family)
MMNSIKLKCPDCGADGIRDTVKRICISKAPELKEEILSGSFFEWKCPSCGKQFFIDDVFLYNDDENKFMVYLVPGYSGASLKIPTAIKTDAQYDTDNSILRAAAGFVDFVEKIRILEESLDDRAIEAIKAVYSAALAETNCEKVYNMIFEESGDGALSFAVFLEDDDFTVDIPAEAYEQTKKDFSSLFKEPKEKAFLRIDQNWLAEVLTEKNS